jgi:hypothetical protein
MHAINIFQSNVLLHSKSGSVNCCQQFCQTAGWGASIGKGSGERGERRRGWRVGGWERK